MAKWAKVEFKELEELEKRIKKAQAQELDQFLDQCAKELAARLLAAVIKRTPVGKYPRGSGKVGGTLRRGWTGGAQMDAAAYANGLSVTRAGRTLIVTITNPTEYFSYVEYGHRQTPGRFVPAIGKRLKASWVKGRFMLTISEDEVQRMAPKLLERKVKQFLEAVLNG